MAESRFADVINEMYGAEPLPEYQQEWIKTIETVREYTDNTDSLGGLDFGFPQLNEAFNGLNPAVHIIAGPTNVGKSAFCLQIAWQVANINPNTYVLYFALDDRCNDIVPRIVSMDQRIPIGAVKFPTKYMQNESYMNRREAGFKRLAQSVSIFKLRDLSFGDNIEYIERSIAQHRLELPDGYNLCIFIDNFFDIQVRDKKFSGNNEKYEFIAVELERISEHYSCPIVCTAELRKLNGNRRPLLDDIRETIKIVYKAKAIMLVYSEVGIRGQAAKIFWLKDGSSHKEQLFEVKVDKNKLGEFKGRLFYELWPEQSFLSEVDAKKAMEYNKQITV